MTRRPSAGGDAKTVVVIPGHVVDQVDLPSEIFAHCRFSVLAAFARHQKDVVGLVGHAGGAGLERVSGVDPGLGAAGQCQYRRVA